MVYQFLCLSTNQWSVYSVVNDWYSDYESQPSRFSAWGVENPTNSPLFTKGDSSWYSLDSMTWYHSCHSQRACPWLTQAGKAGVGTLWGTPWYSYWLVLSVLSPDLHFYALSKEISKILMLCRCINTGHIKHLKSFKHIGYCLVHVLRECPVEHLVGSPVGSIAQPTLLRLEATAILRPFSGPLASWMGHNQRGTREVHIPTAGWLSKSILW